MPSAVMATSIATRGAVPGPSRGLGAATRRIAYRRSRSRFGTLRLRAEKDDDDAAPSQGPEDDPRSPANLMRRAMSMRAKNIKVKLASLGVSSKDLFEKEELARALANAWGEKLKGTVTLPLRQLVGMPGNPRAGYVVVTLDVGEAGFVDFLIDSGATTALISPQLREMLGASAIDGAPIRGLGAGGETVRQKVTIAGASVGALELGALDAVVTDLAASGLPSVVGGMLGLDFLSRFELELDFGDKAMRFHPIGSVATGALDVDSLVRIPLAIHPTGLRTVSCRLNGCERFPGILDMGSFFSVCNWMAAARAGVGPDNPVVKNAAMTAVGVDGRPMAMSTAPFDLEVCGDGTDEGGQGLRSEYKGECCVGDLPAFASLGASASPFMTVGLDVLGRGRSVLSVGADAVYLTPGDAPGGMWDSEGPIIQ